MCEWNSHPILNSIQFKDDASMMESLIDPAVEPVRNSLARKLDVGGRLLANAYLYLPMPQGIAVPDIWSCRHYRAVEWLCWRREQLKTSSAHFFGD